MSNTILVVDDSATARALFKACLAGVSDYEVVEAGDWDTAVSLAKEKQPNITVVDYNLPEKNGAEIAKLIKDAGVETTFILMTANTQDSVVEEAKTAGIFEVLEKPITAEAIMGVLEKLK